MHPLSMKRRAGSSSLPEGYFTAYTAFVLRALAIGAVLVIAAAGGVLHAEQPAGDLLERARVLPLALEDGFEFRKVLTYTLTPKAPEDLIDPVLVFERKRALYGAVNELDREDRYGQYFTFFWRTKRSAALTVRFEYRQAKLGNYVQAQELQYPDGKGSRRTEFRVVGDDYAQQGPVTAWRALLIEEGRIVALTQSALWQ